MHEQGTPTRPRLSASKGTKEPVGGDQALDAGVCASDIVKVLLGFSLRIVLNQNRMTGGLSGQVQRGRAREVRGLGCGRAAAAVWIGLWFMLAGMAGAQQSPAT